MRLDVWCDAGQSLEQYLADYNRRFDDNDDFALILSEEDEEAYWERE